MADCLLKKFVNSVQLFQMTNFCRGRLAVAKNHYVQILKELSLDDRFRLFTTVIYFVADDESGHHDLGSRRNIEDQR